LLGLLDRFGLRKFLRLAALDLGGLRPRPAAVSAERVKCLDDSSWIFSPSSIQQAFADEHVDFRFA
jgi:hypothetical protein